MAQHAVHQLRGKLLLAHARADERQRFGKGGLGDALRLAHGGDLLLALGTAQGGKYALCRLKRHAQLLFIVQEPRVAELFLLRADAREPLGRDDSAYAVHERVLRVEEDDVRDAARRVLRRLDIARVREEPRAAPRDEHSPVREREAKCVALVFLVGYEQCVKRVLLKLLLNSAEIVHIPVSSGDGFGKLTTKREPCGLFAPTVIVPP